MLVNDLEMFWIGLVYGILRKEQLPPPEPTEWDPSDEEPFTIYGQIAELATRCTIGRAPHAEPCDELAVDLDHSQVRWAVPDSREPRICSSCEVEDALSMLRESAVAAREQLEKLDTTGSVLGRFEEILSEEGDVFTGYHSAFPGSFFGIRRDTRCRVSRRVLPLTQGTLLQTLRFLQPHIAFPPVAYMALAGSGYYVPDWDEAWVPLERSLYEPLGETDRSAAADALEMEFIGISKDEVVVRLGNRLGAAVEGCRRLSPHLNNQLATLYNAHSTASILWFEPSLPTKGVSPSHDSDDPSVFSFTAESSDSSADEVGTRLDGWTKHIFSAARAACTQTGLGVTIPHFGSTMKPWLRALKADLEDALSLTKQLGMDTIREGLLNGIECTAALLNEDASPFADPPRTLLDKRQNNRSNLIDFSEILEKTLVPLLAVELRGRSLEPARGLSPNALGGWAELTANGRDAIREGSALLARHTSPYVVINVLQPTLESIVAKLVAVHLADFRGADLAEDLFALMDHAKRKRDQRLEALASIGLALRRLRNAAVHDDERTYDKHHAEFFLQGLAILLRGLSECTD